MDWLWGVRENEKSGMTWRIALSFTEIGSPVEASVLEGKHQDIKCEMSVRHLRDDVR